jgi:hypothetical protein
LKLAGRGAQVADERGERDVEDRVVEPDHEEGQAEDPKDPPPPLVAFGTFHASASFRDSIRERLGRICETGENRNLIVSK